MRIAILLFLLINLPVLGWSAEASNVLLEKANINFKDYPSLQRGANLYINYCLGCHSMAYLRYNSLAEGIGVVDAEGNVAGAAAELVQNNLIFSDARISDAILSAMPQAEAAKWFGMAPPDLTLVARVRGVDWLYTYLKSFYADEARPFGANNRLFPDVAMPNVLETLQGKQVPIYTETEERINGKIKTVKVVTHLALESHGSMTEAQFDSAVNDLVNFLAYASTPEKVQRQHIGYWVMGFLVIFAILAFFLKREYWRDVKKK